MEASLRARAARAAAFYGFSCEPCRAVEASCPRLEGIPVLPPTKNGGKKSNVTCVGRRGEACAIALRLKSTLTESFSPSRFRGCLAGPPLLVTAVHLPRRMATADWLVRCVHIFNDRQRIFKKLERREQAFHPPLGGPWHSWHRAARNAPPI